jgi:hypothetical protein
MTTRHRAYDEEAWKNAKRICRLNRRQLEMARALGMNPRKLPRLRPSPQQRWKLPVGAFIEELYRKRFGGLPRHDESEEPLPGSGKPPRPQHDSPVSHRLRDPASARNSLSQLGDLICYLTNLADDVQRWLAHNMIDSDVLRQISAELRDIASALETGASIDPIPGIPIPPLSQRPPHRTFRRDEDQEATFDDDEIPF